MGDSVGREWTDEEIEYLIEEYGIQSAKAIANVLCRGHREIIDKAYSIGLDFHKKRKEYFRENYPEGDLEEMAERLDKSVSSIRRMARYYKIRRKKSAKIRNRDDLWSEEEDHYIICNHRFKNARELQKNLPGRTYKAVKKRIGILRNKGMISSRPRHFPSGKSNENINDKYKWD